MSIKVFMWNEIPHPSLTGCSKLSHHLEGYDQETGMLCNISSLFLDYRVVASSETFPYVITVAVVSTCLSINVNAIHIGRRR
jgi:hypothetical protein